MSDVGFLVWKLANIPQDPKQMLTICNRYGIKRLVFKVLDGRWKYNVKDNNDKPLLNYFDVLRTGGIIVEAWGYHYPDNPGAQGDAIEERRQKLGFSTYHLNAEAEWQKPFGMPRAAKTMIEKPKVNNFEMLLCSYREPSSHPAFPFSAFLNHPTMDGSSPQVYWALKHNPVKQLNDCLFEYKLWNKPVIPMGPTFGSNFTIEGKSYYWEPTVDDLVAFREACKIEGMERIYYYSLDWPLTHNRFDMIAAATGYDFGEEDEPTPPPVETPKVFVVSKCKWLNVRSQPTSSVDNRLVVVRAGRKVGNLKEEVGNWQRISLGYIEGWSDGNFLEESSDGNVLEEV